MGFDGRQNPRRLKVAPPPGHKTPGAWLGMEVVTTCRIAGKPAGTKAKVFIRSHGGSGMAIRFEDGVTAGRITEQHVMPANVKVTG